MLPLYPFGVIVGVWIICFVAGFLGLGGGLCLKGFWLFDRIRK